uniref:ERI1 exoribonuclease 2 n=1 Tax=Anas platyrhynchos platyrhynchos TaxID=8840 RepID=U3J7Q5_ANAPP
MATKRLARCGPRGGREGRPGAGRGEQRFGHLVVVDLEATCWRGERRHSPEIIEFPAVLLNTATGEIEAEFHTYVQPQEHPVLSEFCTELTGITQNQVDEGVPLNICLSQFLKWIQKIQQEKKIVFSSDTPSNSISEAKPCTFVTWTDWDLGVCLQYECKRKQLRKPDILNSWIDLKATYKAFYNRKPKGLNGALQDLGLTFVGREHSGLDDSRNTARLAWRMICDGCVLKITKSLDKVKRTCKTNSLAEKNHNSIAGFIINSNVQTEEQQTTCTDSSADIHVASSSSLRTDLNNQAQSSLSVHVQQSHSNLSTGIQQGLNNGHIMGTTRYSPVHESGLVLVSTTISSVNISTEDISTSSDCLPLLADWEDVALIPESQSEQKSDCVEFKDGSSMDILTVFEEETIPKQSAVMSSNNQSSGKSVVPVESLKSIIYKSPDTTIYNVGTVQGQTSNLSAFKLPSAKVNAISSQSKSLKNYSTPFEVPKRKPTSPKMFPPAKKRSFSIYQEKNASFDHSLPLRSSNLSKVSHTILNSTVNLNQPVTAVKNEKPTPPLCNCGRRAKRLYVSNAGPNHGKAFFCCPVGKHNSNKKGCGYFKWENAFLKEKTNVLTLNAGASTSLGTCPSTLGSSSNKNRLFLRPSMRT